MHRIEALLEKLMRDNPAPHSGVGVADCAGWLATHRAYCAVSLDRESESLASWPFAAAVFAGFKAERIAHAFLGGYQAALRELCPTVTGAIALCATEESGAQPKAIQCKISESGPNEWIIEGSKRWVSTVESSGKLIIIAAEPGADEAHKVLRAICVELTHPGVSLQPMPATPFVPEITHAKVRFDAVRVPGDALLPGDGYNQYLKPFRTIEDIHLHGAVVGYLLATARRSHWLPVHTQRLLALVVALAGLSNGNDLSPAKHLALDGIFEQFAAAIAGFETSWSMVDPAVTERWNRDRGLLLIAHHARTLRTEAALRALQRG